MEQITLFSTSACHLCEQALALIEARQQQCNFALNVVDIALSEQLVDLYGLKIPVLKRDIDSAELAWPFDEHALLAFVS